MLRLFITVILLTLIQGCSTIKVPYDFTTEEYPNKGILVASTTVPKFDQHVRLELRYHISKLKKVAAPKRKNYARPINYFYLSSEHMQEDSMFSDSDGVVHAQILNPGKYKLTGWSLSTGINLFIHPKKLKPIYFEIIPGRVTYLGSLNMNNSFRKNIFGTPLAREGIVTFSDEEQRDMDAFSKLAPQILLPIENQVPKVRVWLPEEMPMNDLENLEKNTPNENVE
jgi:hypothetical protein